MTLTPEDEAAIRNLLARYCVLLDVDDTAGWVALFVPEARYEVYGHTFEGHEGLRRMLSRAPGGLHLGGPPVIEPTGADRARTRRNLLFVDTTSGESRAALYEDELVRTDEGWRIASCRCRFLVPGGLSDRPGPPAPAPADSAPARTRGAVERQEHDFDESYLGTPPWDIGRPQPVFGALLAQGAIAGRVLDAGCGTGEHALLAAAAGLEATGIDLSPRAIALAEAKAAERGLRARFLVGDALALSGLDESFDTVLDSGLFHVFDDEQRGRYVSSLASAVRPGGRVLLACFSDRQPGDWGPRRVARSEIEAAFAQGWQVDSIEATQFETNLEPPLVEAWLARITRSQPDGAAPDGAGGAGAG